MDIDFKILPIPEAKSQKKFIWKIFNKGKKVCMIDIVKDFEEGELRIYENTSKLIFCREK